jgi:hypothetical protein
MFKKVIAIVLVFLASGTWFYLDCMNKQEQGASAQIHQGIEQARAEAKKRMLADAKFGYHTLLNFTVCQTAAESAQKEYLNLVYDAVPNKQGKFIMPHTVTEKSIKILTAAKAECQKTYDALLKSGP